VIVWQHTRSTLRAQLLRRRWKGGLIGGVSEARVAVAMSSKLSKGIRRWFRLVVHVHGRGRVLGGIRDVS
jgi:hypothetical protein